MSDYMTRRGTRRGKGQAKDLYRIPYREARDDGRTLLCVGERMPICPDCGRGELHWAEAGYVAWHRICSCCGSHWDLHPIAWGPQIALRDRPAAANAQRMIRAGDLVRWADGVGEVPLVRDERIEQDGCPYTWGDVVDAISEQDWAAARERQIQMAGQVVVSCCWARRAQFYEGR